MVTDTHRYYPQYISCNEGYHRKGKGYYQTPDLQRIPSLFEFLEIDKKVVSNTEHLSYSNLLVHDDMMKPYQIHFPQQYPVAIVASILHAGEYIPAEISTILHSALIIW